MGVVKVKSITLEDGRLTRSESGWVYTGARGTFTGSTPSEALAKAYNQCQRRRGEAPQV